MSDRLISVIRAIVREMLPNAQFLGVYEYAVQSWTSDTVAASPVAGSIGLPPIVSVPLVPSITGGRAKLAAGAVILVGFVNGDRGRPFVANGDPNSKVSELWLETDGTLHADGSTVIVNGGVLGCARMTDPVQAGPFAGTITGASITVKVG